MLRTASFLALLLRGSSAEVDSSRSCYSSTVSLLQTNLKLSTGRSTALFLPDHAKILQYVKKLETFDVQNIYAQELTLYHELFPDAHGEPTFDREVQRCIGTIHKLGTAAALDSSAPSPSIELAIAQRTVIDDKVHAFEEVYPPQNVTDAIASYACVHFVDLENMIRAKASTSPESFDAQNIAQNWKPVADDIFKTYGDLYGYDKLTDPFKALSIMASAHTLMVDDSLAAISMPAMNMASMS